MSALAMEIDGEIADACACQLGESLLWHAAEQAFYWLDLLEPALFRMAPGYAARRVPLDLAPPLGSIVATERAGTLMLMHGDRLSLLDARSGTVTPFARPEGGRPGVACNDSKVDRFGRLWVGTHDLTEQEPRGVLWCLPPGKPEQLGDSGFVVSNGPAFSPDGSTLYFSDSIARRILAYDLSPDHARLENRRVFATMALDEGVPDGITVDSDGGLWVAHWDGWRVTRFSPEGERSVVIPLPVPRVTSLAFGGPGLARLYVTTARCHLPEVITAIAPDAGHLFVFDTPYRGLPERPFALPATD